MSWHLRKGGQGLQRTEKIYEHNIEMLKSSKLRNCCTITKFRFRLSIFYFHILLKPRANKGH